MTTPEAKMTGFGSPCGACKFLRRKCVRSCVFSPYFCHEQGATDFAAIHKIFGTSNVSKLLMHLPVPDRYEAALTISYEARARLQDPIYGCVAHIFALQQQVVILQAQLASMQAQAAQNFVNGSTTAISTPLEDEFCNKIPPYQQDGHGMQQFHLNPSSMSSEEDHVLYYDNGLQAKSNCTQSSQEHVISFGVDEYSSCSMASLDMQMNTRKSAYQEMEDLQSVALAHLHHT